LDVNVISRDYSEQSDDYSVISRELSLADHPALGHKLGSDVVARFKSQLQIGQIHLDPFLLEDVGEAALWQPPLKRHLSALKTRATGITRT